MTGQYEYIFRHYGVRPVIGGRVEHSVTGEFGTILKEGDTHKHYVHVRFDGCEHPGLCHPLELDFLAPDEIEVRQREEAGRGVLSMCGHFRLDYERCPECLAIKAAMEKAVDAALITIESHRDRDHFERLLDEVFEELRGSTPTSSGDQP